MNFLIGIGAKLFGIDMDKVNGWKTYAGGAIELLTGAAGALGAAAQVVQELVKLASVGDYLTWGQSAYQGHDPAVIALLAAVAVCGKGLADIGLAHKHDKLLDAIKNPPSSPVPADPSPTPVAAPDTAAIPPAVKVLAFLALAALMPARAHASYATPPQSFVAVATFTASGAAGTGSNVIGFFNHASTITNTSMSNVYIQRIELANCSTQTVSGGTMAFWVYTASAIVDGSTLNVSSFSYAGNAWPQQIIMSTSPTGVGFANNTATLPILAPCILNNDETSAVNLANTVCFDANTAALSPIRLTKGVNSGIVIQQNRFGTSDISGGCVLARVVFTTQ